jgi:hypothetical protein
MRTSTVVFCFCLVLASTAQDVQRFSGNWQVDEKQSKEKATAVANPPPNAPQIPLHLLQVTNSRLKTFFSQARFLRFQGVRPAPPPFTQLIRVGRKSLTRSLMHLGQYESPRAIGMMEDLSPNGR